MRPHQWRGLTLVELIIVVAVSGILFVITPPIVFHGVKTLVFMPRALAVNHVATEVLHQIVEGGFSTLAGQTTITGLRFAVRSSADQPALWNCGVSLVGFRTAANQCVAIELSGGQILRRIGVPIAPATVCTDPGGPSEVLARGFDQVQIVATPPALFQYNSGVCNTVRRIDIGFVAQTGGGNFDLGEASEQIASSVAIRVP